MVDLFTLLSTQLFKAGKYDESKHPRDEYGRWTDSGGGIKSGVSHTTSESSAEGWFRGSRDRAVVLTAIGLQIATIAGAIYLFRRGSLPQHLRQVQMTTQSGVAVPILSSGAVQAEASVMTALSLMPKAHLEQLVKNGVKIAPIKDMGALGKAAFGDSNAVIKLFGAFDPRSKILVVPQVVPGSLKVVEHPQMPGLFQFLPGKPIVVDSITQARALLHESAHALDARGKLSHSLSKTMAADLAVADKALVGKINGYLNGAYAKPQHSLEMFAEVYAAKYLGKTSKQLPYFTELTHTQVVAVFPRTIRSMDKMNVNVNRFIPRFVSRRLDESVLARQGLTLNFNMLEALRRSSR